MTKRDADKLRKMRDDLYTMSFVYEDGSLTQHDMHKVAAAISSALAAKKFAVTGVNISEEYRKHGYPLRTQP